MFALFFTCDNLPVQKKLAILETFINKRADFYSGLTHLRPHLSCLVKANTPRVLYTAHFAKFCCFLRAPIF